MNEPIVVVEIKETANVDSVQDKAIDVLTIMLYRMYQESVVNDGNSGRAA